MFNTYPLTVRRCSFACTRISRASRSEQFINSAARSLMRLLIPNGIINCAKSILELVFEDLATFPKRVGNKKTAGHELRRKRSTMKSQRPRAARYPFVATATLTDLESG